MFGRVNLIAIFASFVAGSASAEVIYTNGPTGGMSGAGYISGSYAISDSLIVGATATVSRVELTVWNMPGETPLSVDFAFTTDPDSFPDEATAPLAVDDIYPSASGQLGTYAVEDVSFDVQNVELSSGAWWLVLQNGVTAQGGQLMWDSNFGSSLAYQAGVGAVGSNTFTVYGDSVAGLQTPPVDGASVPEPDAWVLMLLGVGAAGGARRKTRMAAASLAPG